MFYHSSVFRRALPRAQRGALLAALVVIGILGLDAHSGAQAGFLEDLFGVGAPSHGSYEPDYAPVRASRRSERRGHAAVARHAARAHVSRSRHVAARLKASGRGATDQNFSLGAVSETKDRGVRQIPIDLAAAKMTAALDRSEDVAPLDKTAAGVAARNAALRAEDFLVDRTLRKGDVVATGVGLRVFVGQAKAKQKAFLSLTEMRDLSREKRGALAAIDKALKLTSVSPRPIGGTPAH